MAQGARLTPEQIQRIAEALETSPSWRAAADHAGVNERTIGRYRERAEAYANRHNLDENVPYLPDENDPDWHQFDAVTAWVAARSRLEMRLVSGVLEAIPKDWKAAHAMLKSGWPADYSDRVELTGAGGGPIQVSTEELEKRAVEMLAEIEAKRLAAGNEPVDSQIAPPAGDTPEAE